MAEKVARWSVFKEFPFLYVVVNSKLQTYDEEMLPDLGNRWALLNYIWLQLAAERASLNIERYNDAALMLIAIARNRSGGKANERKVSKLAGELVTQQEDVIDRIMAASRFTLLDRTPGSFSSYNGELLVYVKQYTDLCEQLVQAHGLGVVRVGLRIVLPGL